MRKVVASSTRGTYHPSSFAMTSDLVSLGVIDLNLFGKTPESRRHNILKFPQNFVRNLIVAIDLADGEPHLEWVTKTYQLSGTLDLKCVIAALEVNSALTDMLNLGSGQYMDQSAYFGREVYPSLDFDSEIGRAHV